MSSSQARLGVALVLEALLELRLAAGEVLLLDLFDLLRDLLVGHVDAQLVGLARVLLALDEVGDRLGLQRLVVRRPGLREVALLRGVGLLRPREQPVERGPRDRGAVDDRDGIGRDLVRAAAAGGDESDSGQCGGGECERALHRVLFVGDDRLRGGYDVYGKGSVGHGSGRCSRRAQAARRAATIASASARAPSSPSARIATSCRADVYTAVSAIARSARSSVAARPTGPTVARPPRKTR